MTRLLAAAAIILACFGFALLADSIYFAPSAPAVTCYEDEPCWDCETMGNRICGEEVTK